MNMLDTIPPLQEGDHLLYTGHSFFDTLIKLKTWSHVCHIEIYDGNNRVLASRNKLGVNRYEFRWDGICAILRPKHITKLGLDNARDWFEKTARGQGYDWLGLLCFTLAVAQGSSNRMFCSEFAKNYDVEANLQTFHSGWPADKVAPGEFLTNAGFDWLWINFTP